MMKAAFARREFFKNAAKSFAFLGVGSAVYDTMLGKFFQRAMADTAPALNPSGYYVNFSMPGGPPRWYFDLPLAPNGDLSAKNFTPGNFGTYLEKVSGEFKSTYHVDKHVINGTTLYLPPVWKYDLTKQKFADLLPHTLFVRGLDMEINNHALSNARQVAPIIGGYSIHGVVADGANRPVPGIVDTGATSGLAFKSAKGLSANQIPGGKGNQVGDLLFAFKNYMKGRVAHGDAAKRLEEQAFKEFEKYAEDHGITNSALTKMYDNAMELIDQNIYGVADQWGPTVAKYKAIMDEAWSPKKGALPGLFDSKIETKNNGLYQYTEGHDYVQQSDLRDIVGANVSAPQMAENFAIGELLLDKVTSTMTLTMRGASGYIPKGTTGSIGITHDQHNIGAVLSTMTTTLYYRAMMGCMTEFVSQLKSKGLFGSTVIHISAEFNRTPKTDGTGADHGYMAGNTTLISGMINKPAVIGNIAKDSYSATYGGTFGVAKVYVKDEGFNRAIQVNDVARTITSMLGVRDIVTNGWALLAPDGDNKWQVRRKEANNV